MKSVAIENISRTHSPNNIDGKVVFGILRNPTDSIASRISYNYYIKDISDISPREYAIQSIQGLIDLYKDVYNYYLNNECFLILNEELRKSPKKTINGLFEIFNIKDVFRGSEDKDLSLIKEAIDGAYVVSSKSLSYYKEIMDFVLELDLSELDQLYKESKERAVSF